MKDGARAKGGHARAKALSAEERSAIASQAAKRRWEQRAVEGSRKEACVLGGYTSVLNLAGMKLPCAIVQLPSGEIKRVLSESGITNAILGSRSGASKRLKKAASEVGALLPLFLAPGQLNSFITQDLIDGPLAPIDYKDDDKTIRAYDAEILPIVCKIWLAARDKGALLPQQEAKAAKAEILRDALAKTAIVALIDEATGYEKIRPQKALETYIALVIRKELAAWAKKFPDEFYINIYRLKGWVWPGMGKNRYSAVAQYTNDLVYHRLGPGLLEELIKKSPQNEKGRRPIRFHQWLTEDIGHPLLAQHLHALLMFQRLALANGFSWQRFVRMIDQAMPKCGSNLLLPFPDETIVP